MGVLASAASSMLLSSSAGMAAFSHDIHSTSMRRRQR
jgi:hypothetical protein